MTKIELTKRIKELKQKMEILVTDFDTIKNEFFTLFVEYLITNNFDCGIYELSKMFEEFDLKA